MGVTVTAQGHKFGYRCGTHLSGSHRVLGSGRRWEWAGITSTLFTFVFPAPSTVCCIKQVLKKQVLNEHKIFVCKTCLLMDRETTSLTFLISAFEISSGCCWPWKPVTFNLACCILLTHKLNCGVQEAAPAHCLPHLPLSDFLESALVQRIPLLWGQDGM